METKNISLSELDAIDPANLIIFYRLGNGNILLKDGNDIIKDVQKEIGEEVKLSMAIVTGTNDMSGNSFDLIMFCDRGPYRLSITDWD